MEIVRDIIHFVADAGRALFFGHATHAETFAMAEEVEKLGFKRDEEVRRVSVDNPGAIVGRN